MSKKEERKTYVTSTTLYHFAYMYGILTQIHMKRLIYAIFAPFTKIRPGWRFATYIIAYFWYLIHIHRYKFSVYTATSLNDSLITIRLYQPYSITTIQLNLKFTDCIFPRNYQISIEINIYINSILSCMNWKLYNLFPLPSLWCQTNL